MLASKHLVSDNWKKQHAIWKNNIVITRWLAALIFLVSHEAMIIYSLGKQVACCYPIPVAVCVYRQCPHLILISASRQLPLSIYQSEWITPNVYLTVWVDNSHPISVGVSRQLLPYTYLLVWVDNCQCIYTYQCEQAASMLYLSVAVVAADKFHSILVYNVKWNSAGM